MCIFPIRIENGDDVIKHIFPSKQKDVQALINQAKINAQVKKLFVFGSALTWNCGIFSDLDVAIEHDENAPFEQIASSFLRCVKGKTDILEYNGIQSDLLKKNIKNGVLVYERAD